MGIKRYTADADTTITNAFKSNLQTRGTGSNMGRADSLEVFSIYGQEASGSTELTRTLVRFPIASLTADRAAGALPASGSVSFYLRMFNAVTPFTVPRDYVLNVQAVSGAANSAGAPIDFAWQEGNGLDMEDYSDITRNGIGANWLNLGSSSTQGVIEWGRNGDQVGGTYYTDTSSSFTQTFENGTEDLEVDITTLVEQWMNSAGNVLGSKSNYGIGVHLSSSYEAYQATASTNVPANTQGAKRSYYTKKFFARSSEFFYKKPIIEARWDSATKDYRGDFHYSSSLATAAENLNTIYLYNYFRGQLRNIPDIGTGLIFVKVHSGSANDTAPSGSALTLVVDGKNVDNTSAGGGGPTVVTGGYVSTGIYSASFAITSAATPLEHLYDVWHSGNIEYHTGTIAPQLLEIPAQAPSTTYASAITNLKPTYNTAETSRFRVFTRQKDWSPSIYTKAVATVPPLVVESGSFAVIRMIDDLDAVQFGTGSDLHTQMSFDVSGSYFDLDMSLLEPGYSYKVKLAYYNGSIGDWQEQPEEFRFRVEET
jgi:hypothetical protein